MIMRRLNQPISDDTLFKIFSKVMDATHILGEKLVEDINTRKKIFFPDQVQLPNNTPPP